MALPFLVVMVRRAGGLAGLSRRGAGVLFGRGLVMLTAYTTYYLALPAMPLASAVTLWFTAPLFLAALAGPIAREPSPRSAWVAVLIGFGGVLVMVRPGGDLFTWAAALPIVSALTYAVSQLLARRVKHLGSAPVMTFYQNGAYLAGALVLAFVLRPFADLAGSDPSVAFLLRGWAVPSPRDLLLLALCGPIAAYGSNLLSSAYWLAGSAVAPFEYSSLIWATAWGAAVWGEIPGVGEVVGAALIVASGIYAVGQLNRGERAP